ncbi:MAG: HAD family hydrolase [Promethearchaeia archaeon]
MEKLELNEYSGIIFDLDGVIFNIINAIQQAVEDAVEKYQIEVDIDEVLQEVAHLIEDLQHYPVPKIILKSYDLLKVNFLDGLSYFKKLRVGIYLFNQFNKYKEDARIYPEIDGIISSLSEQGKKLAVLTNNKNTHAEEVLEKYGLNKYFDLIIGFNEVNEVKPSPEGIQLILKKWGIEPSKAIFIGDMVTDIQAGKSAEVKMLCMTSGLASEEKIKEYNPDMVIKDTAHLKQVFGL